MEASTLTLCLIGGFFVINLIVGLWAGRNVKDIKDYALANKSYGTGPLVMTYLATVIGGAWVFVRPEEIFKYGIGSTYVVIFWSITMLLQAKYIAPRMYRFKNCLSLGEIVGTMYGNQSKMLAGFLGIVYSCIITGMNISFLSVIFEKFLGLNGNIGILIGTSLVIIYSCLGGMRAITATDIIQYIALVAVLLLLGSLAIKRVGGIEILLRNIPAEKFSFWESKKLYPYLSLILTFLFLRISDPAVMDRMLMAKSSYQLRNVLYIGSFAQTIIIIVITLISFCGLVLYPQMNSANLFLELTNNLGYDWLKGVIGIGIIAILFSTADSYIHSAGVSFCRNILKPILCKDELDENVETINEVKWTRIGTFIAGVFSIWFSIWGKHLFKPDFLATIIQPILAAPLLFGILGIQPEKKAFWISAIFATITLIICKTAHPVCYPIISGMALFISCSISAITYLVVHIYLNDGAIVLDKYGEQDDEERREWKPNFNQILKKIWAYCRFAERSRNTINRYGSPPYVWFGVTYLVILSAPYFIGIAEPEQYTSLLISLRLTAIVICGLLITESIWPDIMHRYISVFWYISLIYCLPFLSTVLILLTNGTIEYVIGVAILTMLLIAIINWVSAISIVTIGVLAGVCFYKYYVCKNFDTSSQQLDFHIMYILGFELVCSTVVGIIFMRKKQDALELIRSRNVALRQQKKSLEAHLHDSLSIEEKISKGFGMPEVNMVERLAEMDSFYNDCVGLAKRYEPEKQKLEQRYTDVQSTIGFLQNLSERSRDYLKLKVARVELDDFLELVDSLASTYILYSRYSIVIRTRVEAIECDTMQIGNVIANVLNEIFELNLRDEFITIELSDTEIIYKMPSLPNYEKRVKAFQFTISTTDRLSKRYYPASYDEEEINPRDIPPIEGVKISSTVSQRIIAAHFGLLKTFENDFTTVIVIPQNVREVRSIASDEDVPYEIEKIDWPGAQELEDKFKEEIKQKAPKVNLEKVERALDIIKRYHSKVKRKSGEPYYLHPLNVAMIELEWCQNEEAILGALMHDLLEDTAFGIIDIKTIFGNRVADIVYGVSKMDVRSKNIFQNDKEHLKSLQNRDFVIQSIKVSDRLHNMRTLAGHNDPEKRRKIAQETLDFFVPLAKNLELKKAYEELKLLAEKELQ